MVKHSDVVEFFRDLCVLNSDINIFPEQRETLEEVGFIFNANRALNMFRDAFCHRFHKIFSKLGNEGFATEEQFFCYAIPRCLKIIADDYAFEYYFSFMLVAAFIQELVYFIESEMFCYNFSGTAYKCLVAVFDRGLKEIFEYYGGWIGLEKFCDAYGDWAVQRKHKRLASYLTHGNYALIRRTMKLIKECDDFRDDFSDDDQDDVQDECFNLNRNEISLLAMDKQLSLDVETKLSITESSSAMLPMEQDKQRERVVRFSESSTYTELKPLSPLKPSSPVKPFSSSTSPLKPVSILKSSSPLKIPSSSTSPLKSKSQRSTSLEESSSSSTSPLKSTPPSKSLKLKSPSKPKSPLKLQKEEVVEFSEPTRLKSVLTPTSKHPLQSSSSLTSSPVMSRSSSSPLRSSSPPICLKSKSPSKSTSPLRSSSQPTGLKSKSPSKASKSTSPLQFLRSISPFRSSSPQTGLKSKSPSKSSEPKSTSPLQIERSTSPMSSSSPPICLKSISPSKSSEPSFSPKSTSPLRFLRSLSPFRSSSPPADLKSKSPSKSSEPKSTQTESPVDTYFHPGQSTRFAPVHQLKSLVIESISDSESSWESSDSEPSSSHMSSGREKLKNRRSKLNPYVGYDSKRLHTHPSGYFASSDSDLESSGCVESSDPSRFAKRDHKRISREKPEALLYFADPKVYGKTLFERVCKRCNKPCYKYAKYFITKHRELLFSSVKEETFIL